MKRLWQEDNGQDLVEYALLVVLVGLVCIASMQTLANGVSNIFSNAASTLTTNS